MGIYTGIAKLDKIISNQQYYFFLYFFINYIHITTCLGICPRTDAYFCFATNAEKGLRQGENNN